MDRSRGTGRARGGPASRRTGARSPPRTGYARGGPAARTWTAAEGPGAHVGALQRARGAPAEGTGRAECWTGDSEAPRGMRTPVVGRGGRPLPRQPPVVGVARAVLRAMPCFQREVSHAGRVRGLFCEARPEGVLPGPRARGGALGLFRGRSGVLKGIPSLRKRYNACEVWHRRESGGIAVKTVHWHVAPGFRCSRARWFHCGTRILMDGHCAFRVRGADQRRRIPLPGCAGRSGGLAGPAIGAPAAATSGPVPSDRADRPRLVTGPTGRQPHR